MTMELLWVRAFLRIAGEYRAVFLVAQYHFPGYPVWQQIPMGLN